MIKDRTLVYPKQLSCIQINQRLIELNDQQKKTKNYATRLIDCAQLNCEQEYQQYVEDSKTDHNRLRKDDRRLEYIFYELTANERLNGLTQNSRSILIQLNLL